MSVIPRNGELRVSAGDTCQRVASRPPVHDARALTQGGITAQIELDGIIYNLRITRAGKLILTK